MWGWFTNILKKKGMFGVDVSHHQGRIDWAKVANNNPKVEFAYIKASTGVGSSDERALHNAAEARSNGIKVGYYHYCSLNNKDEVQDAISEATWFARILRNLPYSDLPVILDIEDQQGAFTTHLTPQEILTWINTFFSTLRQNGIVDYAIYSYTPFLNQWLPPNHGLGNIKLWIAHYTSNSRPTLPAGWTSQWLWQFSNSGSVQGISSKVDLNKQ